MRQPAAGGVAGQGPQQVDGVATQSGVDRDRRGRRQALDPLGGNHREPVGHLDEALERLTRWHLDRRHPPQQIRADREVLRGRESLVAQGRPGSQPAQQQRPIVRVRTEHLDRARTVPGCQRGGLVAGLDGAGRRA